MMSEGVRITNFPRLDESVQFLLPILELHPHISVAPGSPENVKIGAETLVLIEGRDGAVHSVAAFESDGGIGLRGDRLGHRIEKILLHFSDLEVGVERDGQGLQIFHLRGAMDRAGASGEGETKGSQQDSHDASMKGELSSGVNFPRVPVHDPARADDPVRFFPLFEHEQEHEQEYELDYEVVYGGSRRSGDAINFPP